MQKMVKMTAMGLLASAAVAVALPVMAGGWHGGWRGGMHGGWHGGMHGAGPAGEFMRMSFADLDVDGSESITEEDLLAVAQARLAKADANGDGELDADELLAAAKARFGDASDRRAEFMAFATEWRLKRRDADGNGKLSAAEMAPKQGFGRWIDRFDTDDDNAIGPEEFAAAKEEMGRGGHGWRGGAHGGMRGCDGGKR